MALHDVSKSDDGRKVPRPNANDDIHQRYAHGTVQNQNSQEDPQADGLKFLERQIIAKQGGFNKAAFGFYGAANKFGLKVADDGVDVLTATDDQLIFNSEQNVFKILATDTSTFSIPATTTGSQLISNLQPDFIPIPWVFLTDASSGTYVPLPHILSAGISGVTVTIGCYCYAQYVEGAGLYIQYINATASILGPFTFRWYLLQETAS